MLNPYNNIMHVGGSSGGTTAAVAMRLAPAGFCSDTGKSQIWWWWCACHTAAAGTGLLLLADVIRWCGV